MRHTTRFLSLFAVLGLLLTACGSDDDATTATDGEPDPTVTTAPDDDPFAAGSWVLTAGTVDGDELVLLESHAVTLTVEGDDVGGTAACNGYGGALADGDSLFTTFSVTEMACEPAAAMDLESQYLAALVLTTGASLDGETLVLTGEGVELRFEAVAATTDSELIGTNWILESLIDGEAVSSTVAESVVEVVFEESGRITGNDGCNGFNGDYTIDGDTLEIGPLAQTRRACDPDLTAQATHVTTVLAGTVTWAIDGDSLLLTGADDLGLDYRAEMAL